MVFVSPFAEGCTSSCVGPRVPAMLCGLCTGTARIFLRRALVTRKLKPPAASCDDIKIIFAGAVVASGAATATVPRFAACVMHACDTAKLL